MNQYMGLDNGVSLKVTAAQKCKMLMVCGWKGMDDTIQNGCFSAD